MHAPRRSLVFGVAAVTLLAIAACRNSSGNAAGARLTPPTGAASSSAAPSPAPIPSSDRVIPTPAPTPTSTASPRSTPHPSATIHPTVTIRPTLTIRPTVARPDLTIGLARTNACTWATDADGDVWMNPLIVAHGTGLFLPTKVSFNMISNYDKHTAGGQLTVNAPQTWAIDIGPSASLPVLGHVLRLTLTVDPTHEVAESNESNNTAVITINLTGVTTPPGIADTPIACS